MDEVRNPECDDGVDIDTDFRKVSEDLDPPVKNSEKETKKTK